MNVSVALSDMFKWRPSVGAEPPRRNCQVGRHPLLIRDVELREIESESTWSRGKWRR
jgi:hypothetical protein